MNRYSAKFIFQKQGVYSVTNISLPVILAFTERTFSFEPNEAGLEVVVNMS